MFSNDEEERERLISGGEPLYSVNNVDRPYVVYTRRWFLLVTVVVLNLSNATVSKIYGIHNSPQRATEVVIVDFIHSHR